MNSPNIDPRVEWNFFQHRTSSLSLSSHIAAYGRFDMVSLPEPRSSLPSPLFARVFPLPFFFSSFLLPPCFFLAFYHRNSFWHFQFPHFLNFLVSCALRRLHSKYFTTSIFLSLRCQLCWQLRNHTSCQSARLLGKWFGKFKFPPLALQRICISSEPNTFPEILMGHIGSQATSHECLVVLACLTTA